MTPQSAPWVFLSVHFAAAEGPASLEEVVSTADAINHSVPTPEELVGFFGALVRADLVLTDHARFSLGAVGLKIMSEIDSVAGVQASWHEKLKLVDEQLAALIRPCMEEPALPYPQMHDAQEAIAAYMKRSENLLAESKVAFEGLQEFAKASPYTQSWLRRFAQRIFKRSSVQ